MNIMSVNLSFFNTGGINIFKIDLQNTQLLQLLATSNRVRGCNIYHAPVIISIRLMGALGIQYYIQKTNLRNQRNEEMKN